MPKRVRIAPWTIGMASPSPSAQSASPAGRLLLLGILFRRRFLSLLGLAGVVADVTVAELGGFKAMNEGRGEPPEPDAADPG